LYIRGTIFTFKKIMAKITFLIEDIVLPIHTILFSADGHEVPQGELKSLSPGEGLACPDLSGGEAQL